MEWREIQERWRAYRERGRDYQGRVRGFETKVATSLFGRIAGVVLAIVVLVVIWMLQGRHF